MSLTVSFADSDRVELAKMYRKIVPDCRGCKTKRTLCSLFAVCITKTVVHFSDLAEC